MIKSMLIGLFSTLLTAQGLAAAQGQPTWAFVVPGLVLNPETNAILYILNSYRTFRNLLHSTLLRLPIQRNIDMFRANDIPNVDGNDGNYRNATAGQLVGTIAPLACRRCRIKRSRLFHSCVIVPNQFSGCCMNCQYSRQTKKCSFHRKYYLLPLPKSQAAKIYS